MVQAQKAAEHKTFEVTKAETRPYLEILKHGYDGDIHIKLTSRDDKNPESIKNAIKLCKEKGGYMFEFCERNEVDAKIGNKTKTIHDEYENYSPSTYIIGKGMTILAFKKMLEDEKKQQSQISEEIKVQQGKIDAKIKSLAEKDKEFKDLLEHRYNREDRSAYNSYLREHKLEVDPALEARAQVMGQLVDHHTNYLSFMDTNAARMGYVGLVLLPWDRMNPLKKGDTVLETQ